MRSFSGLLSQIEKRARHIGGLRLAGFIFLWGSFAVSGMAGLDYLHLISVDNQILLLSLFFPALCFVAGYLIGRAGKPHLPQILLKMDLILGTNELLSSLYELHYREDQVNLQKLLESKLQKRKLDWKLGLPVKSSTWITNGAGVLLLCGTFLFLTYPLPLSGPEFLDKTASTQAITEQSKEKPYTSPEKLAQAGKPNSPERDNSSQLDSQSDDLDTSLDEIRDLPSSEAILSNEKGELSKMIERQKELSSQLSDFLSRLQKRLQEENNSPLTPQEREDLNRMLSQVRDQNLHRALEKILKEEDPKDLKELAKEALKITRDKPQGNEQGRSKKAGQTETSPQAPEDKSKELRGQKQATFDEGNKSYQQRNGEGIQPGSSSGGPGEKKGLKLEDQSRFGGKEGSSGGSSDQNQERSPEFELKKLIGKMGKKGDFEEFVTKGVPLEPADSQEGTASKVYVNYQTLRAILESRPLSPGLREIIKRYFEEISQGES